MPREGGGEEDDPKSEEDGCESGDGVGDVGRLNGRGWKGERKGTDFERQIYLGTYRR